MIRMVDLWQTHHGFEALKPTVFELGATPSFSNRDCPEISETSISDNCIMLGIVINVL